MGRTSIGDEPASLDSQTHCSLGRGLIDAESLRISRCDRGRRRHLRHRCLFGVVDKRQAAMVLDLPKARINSRSGVVDLLPRSSRIRPGPSSSTW
jgi:hypothetical protein